MSSLYSYGTHYRRRRASSEPRAELFPSPSSPFPIHLVNPSGVMNPLGNLRDPFPHAPFVLHESHVHVELLHPSGGVEGPRVLHLHYHYSPSPSPALHTVHLINSSIVLLLALLIVVVVFTTIVKVVPFFIKFGRRLGSV